MILDSSDGKQARKTGSSSPLGMLLDHGCDAVAALVNPTMLMRLFNCTINEYHLLYYTLGCFPFYMVTLETYYSGELNLEPINGASEGSLMYLAVCLWAAWSGDNVGLFT